MLGNVARAMSPTVAPEARPRGRPGVGRALLSEVINEPVDQAAALGGLRVLEAAAGAARAEAGGEDNSAFAGAEASGLTAAARCVGSVPSPNPSSACRLAS